MTELTPATSPEPAKPGSSVRGQIGVARWPLIGARLLAMALLLVISVCAYCIVAPFKRRNPVPRYFMRGLSLVAGLRIQIIGTPADGPSVILANHVSWLDIPALAGTTGTTFVAHDGLAGIPTLRWLCELNNTVFVARHDRRSVSGQIAQVRDALQANGSLTIFPEGTTSGELIPLAFKSSLLSALEGGTEHLCIQPVWLDYGDQIAEIAWVGEESGRSNALRILARWKPVRLTIHFLEPLAGDALADRKAIARNTRSAIIARAGKSDLVSA